MKRIWFITVFFLRIIPFSYSQAQTLYEIRSVIDFIDLNKKQFGEWKSILTEADIEGSPYLDDAFVEGSVFTTSKTRYDSVPLRYNIFNNEVEIQTEDGQVLGLAVPEVVEKLEFGGYQLENVPYWNAKKIRRGFLVVMEKGPATLYLSPRVQFVDAKPAGAYQDAQPPQFVRKQDEYYIRMGTEPAQPVSSAKDIEAAFPDHQKEVASFIKKNKVRATRPESLKELILYYNSLLQ